MPHLPLHGGLHNDSCEMCDKTGSLLCCDFCNLVWHLPCAGLAAVPKGTFMCSQCSVIQAKLTTNPTALRRAANAGPAAATAV